MIDLKLYCFPQSSGESDITSPSPPDLATSTYKLANLEELSSLFVSFFYLVFVVVQCAVMLQLLASLKV